MAEDGANQNVDGAKHRFKRTKKQRISADGTPYTVWQTRTRVLCWLLLAWALIEVAVGAGFITLFRQGIFDLSAFVDTVTVGPATVISGTFNAVVALAGLWGAHNPQRITFFFWAVFLNALLNAWQVASLWSVGLVEPATVASLAIALAYAVCAWNVRGQTGYFDNHPHPDDPDELPIERDARLLRAAGERDAERLAQVAEEGAQAVARLQHLADAGEQLIEESRERAKREH